MIYNIHHLATSFRTSSHWWADISESFREKTSTNRVFHVAGSMRNARARLTVLFELEDKLII